MKNKVIFYPIKYEPKIYVLYVHVRKEPNNKGVYKKYFGITCQKAHKRWKNNGKGYSKKNKDGKYTKFYNAILKYGWDEGFRHIIIFKNLTKKEADSLEKYFIDKYKTLKNNGYNSKEGGANGSWSEEARKKFSEKKKGKPVPNFEKSRLKGELNPCYGKKRDSNLVKQIAEKQMKKVYCVEQKKWYQGVSVAGKINNIDSSSISAVCNNKRKTAGGYHWVYNIDDIPQKLFYPNKKVMCIETGIVFNSIKEAGETITVKNHISEACNGKIKTCGGFHWIYV